MALSSHCQQIDLSFFYLIQFIKGEPIYITPNGVCCCGFPITYSLTQCSKSYCIKEGQNVDAQKWFKSMVSSLLHTNLSHFLILLTLIFWPNWPYFIICILFHINFMSTQNHIKLTQNHFKSTQNHSKSTQNHSKSILINPKHIKHPKSIIIYPILGIVVAFSALETYQPINLINPSLVLSWLSMLGQTIIQVI